MRGLIVALGIGLCLAAFASSPVKAEAAPGWVLASKGKWGPQGVDLRAWVRNPSRLWVRVRASGRETYEDDQSPDPLNPNLITEGVEIELYSGVTCYRGGYDRFRKSEWFFYTNPKRKGKRAATKVRTRAIPKPKGSGLCFIQVTADPYFYADEFGCLFPEKCSAWVRYRVEVRVAGGRRAQGFF